MSRSGPPATIVTIDEESPNGKYLWLSLLMMNQKHAASCEQSGVLLIEVWQVACYNVHLIFRGVIQDFPDLGVHKALGVHGD